MIRKFGSGSKSIALPAVAPPITYTCSPGATFLDPTLSSTATTINLTGCTKLPAKLTINNNTLLKTIIGIPSHITKLDVSGCSALTTFSVLNNGLKSLIADNCSKLTTLGSSTLNKLPGSLKYLSIKGCTSLKSVDVSETVVEYVYITPSMSTSLISFNSRDIVPTVVSQNGWNTLPTADSTTLTTYCTIPFLIQGPIYHTSPTACLLYYINCDAVGTGSGGRQTFGSWYMKTNGTIPDNFYPPGPWDGKVITDNSSSDNSQNSTDYLAPLQGNSAKVIVSFGGYNADIMGLFAPGGTYTSAYSVPLNSFNASGPTGSPWYPAGVTLPSAAQVAQSICYTLYGNTGATNPLGWSNAGWKGQKFDGINIDFENIGRGGFVPADPASFQYPKQSIVGTTGPIFPAQATNPVYAGYPQAMVNFIQTHDQCAHNKIMTYAPLSLSILSSATWSFTTPCSTALHTWFPFTAGLTGPTVGNYNNTPSLALNHPAQLTYFDDVFVQFYNEDPIYYPGGTGFPPLLAQWGFLCLKAQALGIKSPKVNIGLAQGPGSGVPTYNSTVDAPLISSALTTANTMLQASGLTGATGIQISDWCSGAGFWAAGPATISAKTVGYEIPNLPRESTHVWSDAQYPSGDPLWAGNVPITYAN